MRYFIVLLISLSFSQYAFSLKGNDLARQLCSVKMIKSNKRIKCNYLVDQKFFDKDAVKTCSAMVNPKIILDCLTVVAGFKYKSKASLGNCALRNTDTKKLRCISRVKDRKIKLHRKIKNKNEGGLNAAFDLCDSHLRNSDKTNCLTVVRGKAFDAGAVSICRNLTYTSDKNKCLDTIANQKYSVSEIAICKKMTFTSDKLKCLKHGNSSSNSLSESGRSEYDQVLDVCSSFMYASDKNKCLSKVRNKTFSAGTVKVCKELMYVADKLNCLDTIANKKYHDAELRVCSSMMYTADKIKCLKGASTSDVKSHKRGPEELIQDALGFMKAGKTNRAKKLLRKALSRM